MLQEQVVPVNFGGGVDTKTDSKAVVPGKFIRLENGVFTTANRITKRNGYSAMSTTVAGLSALAGPQMVHGYNDELICADSNNIASYSSNQTSWIKRGSYTSTELTASVVDQANIASGASDCAVLGNYALYGWSTACRQDASFPPIYPSNVLGSVVDLSTGTVLLGPQTLSTAGSIVFDNDNPVRCMLLGSTVLAIFYTAGAGTSIVCRLVTFSGSGVVSFGSELTVTTDASSIYFDVVNTSTGANIIYRNTTGGTVGVTVAKINTSGAVTATATVNSANADALGPMHINTTSNGYVWGYWCDSTYTPGYPITGANLVFAVWDSSLTPVLGKQTVTALASPYQISNIISMATSATAVQVFYGLITTTGTSVYGDRTFSFTISLASPPTDPPTVSTPGIYVFGVAPFSRVFSLTSQGVAQQYAVFIYRSVSIPLTGGITTASQATFFLLQLTNVPSSNSMPLVVARFASGAANTQLFLENGNGSPRINFTPSCAAISSTKMLFSCGKVTQQFPTDYYVSNAGTPTGLAGNYAYTIDFNSSKAYKAVNSGELAILNGGLLQAYDGLSVSEWNFHLYPEITTLTASNGAGALSNNGVYSYIAIFQWVDAQGNLHQSAPSPAKSVTLGAADDTVAITVSTNYLSQKSGVALALYRTTNGGSIYYLITNPVFPLDANGAGSITNSFTDLLSDAQLAGNPQAYTYPASSVLENGTPPPSMAMVAHNDRLWFVNSEEPNEIWYTKTFQQAVGLSPSPFMTEQIDPKFGSIVALAEMDEKLVILKTRGVAVQSGDGVNDTGSGSTLSDVQFVPSDVGCDQMKSVVTAPTGVLFHTPNGIYLLSRSLGVAYIGMEVESYNSQVISAATFIIGKSQIRFLCTSGVTLVYDYIFNQWSTFTNHTGVSATIFGSTYVYARTSGAPYIEASGSYLDNATAIALLAQTSWLALGSIQGFQRVKRLLMLGDFTNGNSASHNLSIAAAYDFSTTFQTAVTYAFGAASASGVFQYRERLPRQKCDSMSLLIQETTTGSSAEYVDLTNISFEVGVKKGLSKLGGAQSVG